MSRERLPNRRPAVVATIRHGPIEYVGRASFWPDGRMAELFLYGGKVGSDLEMAVRDAGVVLSIGLQYGAPLEEVRRALTEDNDGRSAGPVGAMIDALLAERERIAAAAATFDVVMFGGPSGALAEGSVFPWERHGASPVAPSSAPPDDCGLDAGVPVGLDAEPSA